MKITHSLDKKTGVYRIIALNMTVGHAKRINGRFYMSPVEGRTTFAETITCSTMREVKERTAEALDPEFVKKNQPEPHWTVDAARRLCNLSGNEVQQFLREIHEFHRPWLRRNQYGHYMIRRHMENCAEWGHEFAKRWLEKHKPVPSWYVAAMYALEMQTRP